MRSATRLGQPEFHGRIGVARKDMTPPAGIYARMWGSATHDIADGVHRPLLASCLLFQDLQGSTELILITLDAMVFWQEEAVKLRQEVLSKLSLRPEQLIVHPSHSHSTPMLARRHADRPGGQFIAPYLDSLPGLCVELIQEARTAAREGVLGWAYGKCSMAFNRDAIDPATQRDICGLNVNVKADDTVLVGRATDMQGKVIATLVNYAAHPVSLGGGNRLFSPDYIGAMREIVERNAGGVCLFLHGASGDMTPRRSYESDVEAADQNGRELGYAAMAALSSMFPPAQRLEYQGIEESGTALGLWKLRPRSAVSPKLSAEWVKTRLPLRDVPLRADIERDIAACTDRTQLERLERLLARRDLVGDDVEGEFYFTVWRLGEGFIVSTPGEPYAKFQMDLRAKFPDAGIAVLNATDGCLNYLPIPAAYQRDVYQVRVALYEVGSLETVTQLAARAIERMS